MGVGHGKSTITFVMCIFPGGAPTHRRWYFNSLRSLLEFSTKTSEFHSPRSRSSGQKYITYINPRLYSDHTTPISRRLSTSIRHVWFLVLPLRHPKSAEKPATCIKRPIHYEFRITRSLTRRLLPTIAVNTLGSLKGIGIELENANAMTPSAVPIWPQEQGRQDEQPIRSIRTASF